MSLYVCVTERSYLLLDRCNSRLTSSRRGKAAVVCSRTTARVLGSSTSQGVTRRYGRYPADVLVKRFRFSMRSPKRFAPIHWLLAGALVILLDYFTGPYLDSMVLLYPIPAAMAAWGGSPRCSTALAIVLPPGRMLVFHYWSWSAPVFEAVLDTAVIALFSLRSRSSSCTSAGKHWPVAFSRACFPSAASASGSGTAIRGSRWRDSSPITPRRGSHTLSVRGAGRSITAIISTFSFEALACLYGDRSPPSQRDGQDRAGRGVDQAPSRASGLDDSGQSAAMIADHENVGAGRVHRGEDLLYDLSTSHLHGRDGSRHGLPGEERLQLALQPGASSQPGE